MSKAYDSLTFLICFNIVITMTASFGIWTSGFEGNTLNVAFLAVSVVVIAGLLAVAATFSLLTPSGERAVVYTGYSTIFWALWTGNTVILNSLELFVGEISFTLLFLGFGAILWIVTLYQMITGGWKSYV